MAELRAELQRLAADPDGADAMAAERQELVTQNQRLLATVGDLRGEIQCLRQAPSTAEGPLGEMRKQNETLLLTVGHLRAEKHQAEDLYGEATVAKGLLQQQNDQLLANLSEVRTELQRVKASRVQGEGERELRRQNEQLLLRVGDLRGQVHSLQGSMDGAGL